MNLLFILFLGTVVSFQNNIKLCTKRHEQSFNSRMDFSQSLCHSEKLFLRAKDPPEAVWATAWGSKACVEKSLEISDACFVSRRVFHLYSSFVWIFLRNLDNIESLILYL